MEWGSSGSPSEVGKFWRCKSGASEGMDGMRLMDAEEGNPSVTEQFSESCEENALHARSS